MMSRELMLMFVAGGVIAMLVLIVGLLATSRKGKLDRRIDSISGKESPEGKPETVATMARLALPRMGNVIVPENEAERTKLRARMMHAGLYQRQAMHAFLGVKLVLLVGATLVGAGLTLSNIMPPTRALPLAIVLFLAGMFGPGAWLNRRKSHRQQAIKCGLPDAIDVMIICLEGGLSFQASIKKIADELRSAHPILGGELRIVDREIQLGRAPGEALTNFARRSDLEEILSLASVIGQSERFGASLVKSMRNHSESLRHKRKQAAEEKAQKAATLILIPTILFIFPAVFVILLAPAAIQVTEMFAATPGDK
jgi:tight adherence protein C